MLNLLGFEKSTQERLLGAALGSAFAGFFVFEQQKLIHESVSDDRSSMANQSQVGEVVFGKKYCPRYACLWNKAVDQTFGSLIASFSSRKW